MAGGKNVFRIFWANLREVNRLKHFNTIKIPSKGSSWMWSSQPLAHLCMVTPFHLGCYLYLQQSLTTVQFAIVTRKPGFPLFFKPKNQHAYSPHLLKVFERRILSIKTFFHFSQPKILLRPVWLQGENEMECWLVTFRGVRGLEVRGELIWKGNANDIISITSNLKAAYPKLLRADYHGCILNGKFIFCLSSLIYHCWKILCLTLKVFLSKVL